MNSIIDKLIIKLSYFSFICEMVGVWTFHCYDMSILERKFHRQDIALTRNLILKHSRWDILKTKKNFHR